MNSEYKNDLKPKLWKKTLCVILSIIIAFGTFITITFGTSKFQNWLGIHSMLSAYASEIVDTKGAIAVDEDAMKADDHTINLENRDGSNTVYLFSEPISYTDENGNLKTKDISVEKADNELNAQGYAYTNGQNDYRINFSKDQHKGIEAEFDNCSYSIVPVSTITTEGTKSVAELLNEKFDVFQYENIYGIGTNLRFYPQLNGVKDEIVLNQNIGQNIFSFELKTNNCTAQLNDDGAVVLVDKENNIVQTFTAPYAYDSEYVEGDKNSHYVNCEYSLIDKDESSYIMTITVPDNWLTNKNTAYPVIIDPTTSQLSNYRDAGIYNKSSSASISYGKELTCCFGRSSDYGYGRVLNQFTMPSDIKKGAKINNAYTWQRETTGRTTSTQVTPHMITSSWSEGDVTWNTRPSYNSTVGTTRTISSQSSDDSSNPYWYKFNIANMVKQWADGTKTNYGFCFVSSEEENKNYNWRAFTSKQYSSSAMRPYTVINYENDETAPTASGVSGNPTSWVKSATLKIIDAKDNTGGIGLHSKPYSMSTTEGTYNWQTSNSFPISNSGKYYFYVRDAYNNIRLIKDPDGKKYFTVNKVDSIAPTFNASGNPTNWVKSATLVASEPTDNSNGIGLHSTAYSISNSATTPGAWKEKNSFNVTANGDYYIHVRDGLNNSKSSNKISVTKIDNIAPTYTRIDLVDSNPKGTYIDVKVVGAADTQSGLHREPYSFDGGTTWQSSATKRCISAETLNVWIRDAVGNIKKAGQKIVPEPTANAPTINSVYAIYDSDNNKTTITVDAEDVETASENLIYSYNGTVYGNSAEIDGKITNVNIIVTDEHGHVDTGFYNFTFAEKYDYDSLVGLYSESNDSIEYKFDENDEWQEYEGPFEKPDEVTTIQANIEDCITLITLSQNSNEENSCYTENVTDLTITNNDLSFDIARDYSSDSNEWRFSTTASALPIQNGKIVKVNMPDNTNLYFVKSFENKYIDEITGYVIFETADTYSFNAYGEEYLFSRTSGRLLSISNEFNHQIEFSYNSNNELESILAVSDNEYCQYNLSENYGRIESITTPINETLIYQYDNGKLGKVYYDKNSLQYKRENNIILDEYEYSNNRIHLVNGITVNYDDNGNYVSITEPTGETINNKDNSTNNSNDELENSETINSTVIATEEDGLNVKTETYYDSQGRVVSIEIIKTNSDNLVTEKIVKEYDYSSKISSITVTTIIYSAHEKESSVETVVTNISNNTEVSREKTEYTYFDDSDDISKTEVTATQNGKTTRTTIIYSAPEKESSVVIVVTKGVDNNVVSTETIEYTYFDDSDDISKTEVTATQNGKTTKTTTIYSAPEKESSVETVVTKISNNTEVSREKTEYTYFDNSDDVSKTEVTTTQNSKTTKIITEYSNDGTIHKEVTTVNKGADEDKTIVEYVYTPFGEIDTIFTTTYKNDSPQSLSKYKYYYDALNRNTVINSVDEDNNETLVYEYKYDPLGNIIYQNENGEFTRYIYDDYSRLIQQINNKDYVSAEDGLNNSSNPADSYSNGNVGCRYIYSENGNLEYEYNDIGVRTDYTYHKNSSTVATEIFDIYEYDYNTNGDIVDIWVAKDSSNTPYAHYEYNADNKNSSIEYGNGQIVLYDYDNNGNLIRQKYKANSTSSEVIQYEYVYENDDTLVQKIDFVNNQVYNYSSDEINNTTTVSIYTLAYNDNGNVVNGSFIHSYQDEYDEDSESLSTHTNTVGNSSVSSTFDDSTDSIVTSNGTFNLSKTDGENSSTTVLKDSNDNIIYSYNYSYNDDATAVSITSNNYSSNLSYTYDDEGRITSYSTGDNDVENYHYDGKGQLSRVDKVGDYTKTYSYDSRGNIRKVKEYSYTADELDSDDLESTDTYRYDDTDPWPDKLSGAIDSFDEILYDTNGNPISLDDVTVNWTNGRQLSSFNEIDDNGNEVPFLSYTYDDNGIRTSKTYGDVTTYYTNINGNVTSQYELDENGDIVNLIEFIYDSSNEIIGFTYDNQTYFYLKNLQGDVTGIIDSNGNKQTEYTYTVWGEYNASDYTNEYLSNINPIIYRGYLFDSELGAYYLQSRYYVPTYCRFLNSDLPEYAKQQKEDYVGINLFAYCCNEPVNNVDYSGYWGADIHYGKLMNTGKNGHIYNGTFEWLIEKNFDPIAAAIVSAANMQMDKDKDTNPLPNSKPINLYVRQRYHFDRCDGVADTRTYYGSLFFSEAVSLYNDAIRTYSNKVNQLKRTYSTNSSAYKSGLNEAIKKRDRGIANSLVYLGAALHCYQDVYSHGNISEGHNGIVVNIWGHTFQTTVDNPYYKWKDTTKKTSVIENRYPDGKLRLSLRYSDTKNKTYSLIIKFKESINCKNYVFTDISGKRISQANINNKYFSEPDIKVDFLKGKEL